MMKKVVRNALIFMVICAVGSAIYGCNDHKEEQDGEDKMTMQDRVDQYTTFKLNTDISSLSDNQKQIIGLIIEAGQAMDEVFWKEAYGRTDSLMNTLDDETTKEFVTINYGPWDRLADNKPFIDGVGPKPEGANFYPRDMTKKEFENWDSETKDDLYTLVRRDEEGNLMTVPYHEAFAEQHKLAASKL